MVRYFTIALVHYFIFIVYENWCISGRLLPSKKNAERVAMRATVMAIVWPLTDFIIITDALSNLLRRYGS